MMEMAANNAKINGNILMLAMWPDDLSDLSSGWVMRLRFHAGLHIGVCGTDQP